MKALLERIVDTPLLHARWLNTLSFLENCGAKKIAACEHPTKVKEEMLKHAAEEFRHAYYLKSQIERVDSPPLPDFSLETILGGTAALHYLNRLDVQTCRYLKQAGLSKDHIKEAAYLLVTYLVEQRALKLYPVYEEILRKSDSKVRVMSIVLEEVEHLKEMEDALSLFPDGFKHATQVSALEEKLWKRLLEKIEGVMCGYP